MKIFTLIFLLFNFELCFAGSLQCSANGMTVFHIPGAFTSKNDQGLSEFETNKILANNKDAFDLKSNMQGNCTTYSFPN